VDVDATLAVWVLETAAVLLGCEIFQYARSVARSLGAEHHVALASALGMPGVEQHALWLDVLNAEVAGFACA